MRCDAERSGGAERRARRADKAVLKAKEKRLRGRVSELYERAKLVSDADHKGIVRRC